MDSTDRWAAVDAIESEEFKASVTRALVREGSESRDGHTEIFPLPRTLKHGVNLRFWRLMAAGGAGLAIAAFFPGISHTARIVWVLLGAAFAVRAHRYVGPVRLLDTIVEINSYRLTQVWPEGVRITLSFSDGLKLENRPDKECVVVSGNKDVIVLSSHILGIRRLLKLIIANGAVWTESAPPAAESGP